MSSTTQTPLVDTSIAMPIESILAQLTGGLRRIPRLMRREPAFVLGVIVTLALAIGANATMFGIVDRLMLSAPSGIGTPDHVVRLRVKRQAGGADSFVGATTSYPYFLALKAATQASAGVAAVRVDSATIGRDESLTQIPIVAASGDYFRVLATSPALGRFFGASDDEPPFGNSVIVLGYAYWQRAFAGERSVIGRNIVVNGQPFTIIGVAPRDFNGDGVAPVDAYLPLSASLRGQSAGWETDRDINLVLVLARLRDGVSRPAAMQIASNALRDETSSGGRSAAISAEFESITPGADARSSPQAQIALWLTAVSLVVLLIATANVAILFAVRVTRRRRELAVRVALGASCREIAQHLIIECLALTLLGTIAGLVLGRWFAQLVRVVLLPNVATTSSLVDMRVLVASIVVATLAGLGASLAPLLQSRRAQLASDLRDGGEQGGSARFGLLRGLVGAQTALCMILLVGAALFIRSLERVESQDLGFDTQGVLYATLDFHMPVSGAEHDRIYSEAARRVRALPEVARATVAAGIPFGPHNIPPVSVPGVKWPDHQQFPIMYAVTPDYIAAMRVQLVTGRLLKERDTRASPLVVLVNETMARMSWPGQTAIGKCVRAGFGSLPPDFDTDPSLTAPCREVVGVVRDSRARSLRPEHDEDRLMQYYVPFDQIPGAPFPDASNVMGLIVKVHGDAAASAAKVQRTIQSGGRQLFAHVQPYQDLIDPQLRSWRLGATLFSAMGALALAIGAAGLFGVVSYLVAQRSREMGIRLALGGTATRVARLVIVDALRMSGIGIVIGVVGCLIGGPLVAAMLFHTSPRDIASLGAAATVLLLTTFLASAWPAMRAARSNPVNALRSDG